MTDSGIVSLKQLKTNLKDALRKSGAVDAVKAQIRKEFISNLSNGSDKTSSRVVRSLQDRAILSAIYHSLKKRGCVHSLSVLAAECGFDHSPVLSELDIVQALQFGTVSNLYKAVTEKENGSPYLKESLSVLEMMIEEVTLLQRKMAVEATDNKKENPKMSVREELASQSKYLEQEYTSRKEMERIHPNKTVEERMLQFQRECEERMRRDLDSQVSLYLQTYAKISQQIIRPSN